MNLPFTRFIEGLLNGENPIARLRISALAIITERAENSELFSLSSDSHEINASDEQRSIRNSDDQPDYAGLGSDNELRVDTWDAQNCRCRWGVTANLDRHRKRFRYVDPTGCTQLDKAINCL